MVAMMIYKLVRSLRAWLRARVVQDLHLNLIIGSTNDLTAQLCCAIKQTVLSQSTGCHSSHKSADHTPFFVCHTTAAITARHHPNFSIDPHVLFTFRTTKTS